jgi:hypothetical protein
MNEIVVQAVQHLRPMRGGSQSHLMRASDGGFYVVKFQNNPQHVRILANEYMGTRLAKLLGLPVPEVRIVEVSEWLIEHSPEMRIRELSGSRPCSSGRQLGSLYSNGPIDGAVFDYLPEPMLEKVANLGDFARMLVLDKWTSNDDGRQAVFHRPHGKRRYRATFIDHGYCFGAGEWTYRDSPARGTFSHYRVYQEVRSWKDFEPTLGRAETINADDLWSCAAGLPPEWYEDDRSGLERLIEGLYRRRSQIRDLIDGFRRSTRPPFPKWERGPCQHDGSR